MRRVFDTYRAAVFLMSAITAGVFPIAALAQSANSIPLDGLKILENIKSINAPNGFQIIDSQGLLVKKVDESSRINVKGYIEHRGKLYLMSDWSFDRLQKQRVVPNWILVNGLTLSAHFDPGNKPVAESPGSEFYQFVLPDSNDTQAPHLSYVENSQLIYADDEWIVVGKFVRDQSSRGYHYLSAYHANTLQLAFQLKFVNYVFCMDWSAERQQFLAVTTDQLENERLVKRREDDPSVVVIDLPGRKIERLNYSIEFTARARWSGNRILVEYTGDSPSGGDTTRFSRPPFSDISIQTKKVNGSIPSLAERREAFEVDAALDLVHLSNFSEEHHTWHSKVAMDLASVESGSLRILRTTDFGHAVDLNLSELRIKRFGNGVQEISNLSLMDGGIVGYKLEPSIVRFSSPGRSLETDLASYLNEESQFGFSGGAAILVGPTSQSDQRLEVTRFNLKGELSQSPINLQLGKFPNWGLYPERESIITVEYDGNMGQQWREFSCRSSEQIGEPFLTQAAKGISARSRAFGQSEGDWKLTSTIYDSHTDGYTFKVEAQNVVSGKKVIFNDNELNGDDPLHLFDLSDEGFSVLCAGNHKIYLYRHSLKDGKSTLIREWDKNPGHGHAAFDRSAERLFVPRENGYEVFSITEKEVVKVFDLYFHGDSDYAVVLPDGFYAGSPGCESFLSLPSGGSSIAATVVAPWRNRPARVLQALGGSREDISALDKVTERWLKSTGYAVRNEPAATELTVIKMRDGMPLRTAQTELEIATRLEIGSAPPEKFTVSINGVTVQSLEDFPETVAGKSRDISTRVSLSSGQNWIELNTIDRAGTASEPVRFRIICDRVPDNAKRFVVAMGISKYANPALNLELAAKDAQDVAATFVNLPGVSETETLILTDGDATSSAISRVEEFLSQATENDEVIFFGSAHGVLDENLEYVFCTHEFDPANASSTGLKLNSIISAIRKGKSRKCLILLDTCQAGAVGERDVQLLAANDGPALSVTSIKRSPITTIKTGLNVAETSRYIEEMFLMPGSLEGIHIIGASSAAGFALEIEGILNGVFTSALIEALHSGKADLNRNKSVSIDELKEFLENRVFELTSGEQQPSIVASEKDQEMQFPLTTSRNR